MNRTEAQKKADVLMSGVYWHFRGTFPLKNPIYVMVVQAKGVEDMFWNRDDQNWVDLENATQYSQEEMKDTPLPIASSISIKWMLRDQAESHLIEERIRKDYYEPELSIAGNPLVRDFIPDVDGNHGAAWIRMVYLNMLAKWWREYPTAQNCSYYGVWYSFDSLIVVTYTEGDITITRAKDVSGFISEIWHLQDWNKTNGWLVEELDLVELRKECEEYRLRLSEGLDKNSDI